MNNGIVIDNFVGGLNEAVDPTLLKVNESTECLNVNISDGILQTANGSTLAYPNTVYNNIKTLMPYYKNNVGTLLVAYNNMVTHIKSDSDKRDIIAVSNYPYFDSVNFNVENKDVIIFTNGSEHPIIYDGNNALFLKNRRRVYNDDGSLRGFVDANGNFFDNIDHVLTYAPKGKYVELHYERIWIAGNQDHPSTVYFSTADMNGFDPQDWTMPSDEDEVNMHGGEIDVYTNDGGIITALKVVFDDILIFKTKNIFKIFGNNPTNYTKIQIFSSNGAIADRTIVSANDGAYFINRDAIYKYDGTNVVPISQKICKTFSRINKYYASLSVATFYKNKYILAIPLDNATENNIVIEYDTINKVFTYKTGLEVSSFTELNGELLYTNNTGKIYYYDTGNTYNGTIIKSAYTTGDFTLNALDAVKDIESFYFVGSGQGDVKISCITDRKTTYKQVTLSSEEKVYKLRLKNRGRIFRYKIENINGSTFKIKSPKIILELDVD